MNPSETFIRYSLRNRLFVLVGATFFLCAVVILLFFPLLNITLEGLQNRTINSMKTAAEVEATTISRLLVLEFSSVKGLLKVTPTSKTEIDQWIKDLLWEKVTNKEVLQVYHDTFAQKDMVMRPRPHSRRINNVLEKVMEEALSGRQTPEAALAGAIADLKKDQTLD